MQHWTVKWERLTPYLQRQLQEKYEELSTEALIRKVETLTPQEVFKEVLEYEGIIGYDTLLWNLPDECEKATQFSVEGYPDRNTLEKMLCKQLDDARKETKQAHGMTLVMLLDTGDALGTKTFNACTDDMLLAAALSLLKQSEVLTSDELAVLADRLGFNKAQRTTTETGTGKSLH